MAARSTHVSASRLGAVVARGKSSAAGDSGIAAGESGIAAGDSGPAAAFEMVAAGDSGIAAAFEVVAPTESIAASTSAMRADGPPSVRSRRIAEFAILLVMLTWGANVVAVKAEIGDLPPIMFAFLRFGSAFLVLLAVLRWREGSIRLPRADIVPLLLLGLAGFGLYQDLWSTALGRTTASNSALITAATPVSTMLIAAAVGSDTLSRTKLLGVVIAFAGAVGVVGVTHGFGFGGASLGDLMTFAATVCWSCYVAFGAPVLRRHSPLRTATWAIGFGCVGMLPFAIWQAATSFDISRVHAGTVELLLFCSLLAAAAANVVMFEAVKVLGPTRTMLFQFLVPAFAVAFAAIFLGESIVIGQLLGGAVIVLGILVSRTRILEPARV
jgi:drug/metabolite transporter (DMT)-like permease